MTKPAHDKIAAGLAEALKVARGEAEPATVNTGAPSPASLWTLGSAVDEVERLHAALRSVFMSRDHDEAVKRAGDAIGWSVVR